MNSESLDKFAISLSAVCLLHCLITPVVLTLLPVLSLTTYAEELLFHELLLWIVIPTSVIALFLGCRKHRNLSIVATGVVGMAILLSVAFFGHELFGLRAEKWITSLGGLVLAYSHYLNYRTCQSIRCRTRDCATEHHH